MDKLVTVREAAELLGLKPVTIRAWIRRRKITYVRLGRAVRIPTSAIEKIIKNGTVHPK